ncbi:unnamed protein product [Paramecium pentaurelia]|uniref:RING-type domain-containing protein n=1 Tax=Paramecium pentaurelia TaxID=43138 RepID=A0A8S1SQF7_9CILI|nr:unnamed protein product [Paramecium pentaurelia]
MDPKFNAQDTFQCQQCKIYVNKSSQQVHEASCQSIFKNSQGIINNKDVKPFVPNIHQNQSKDQNNGFKQIPLTQIPQIIPQQNNTGIQNFQKIQAQQFPKAPVQNFQFQDNQKIRNQPNQLQFNQPDLNSDGQCQGIRFFPKEKPIQNLETNNQKLPQQIFPQVPLTLQKNQVQQQILLPQQQQNSNIFQINSEIGRNQNQTKFQNQQGNFGAFQNQKQIQEQSKIFITQEQQNKVNINQQQSAPNFRKIDTLQQKQIKVNPPIQNNNIFQNKNFQQFQPQQFQQQQHNIYNSQSIIQSPQFQNFNQQQNNRLNGDNQIISHSQPIQGQPYIPLQFPAPQIPQNIQPPPSIQSIFTRFSNPYDSDDDDDDDDDNNEYHSLNFLNRGLPNFDVNKQYTDSDVNRMNQEQFYQYFSSLYVNENHGYSEDQINQKICKNFSMKFDDIRIDICVICQEEFTQETFTTDKQLPCSHLFHENCLIGWLKRSKQCPICKTEIEL